MTLDRLIVMTDEGITAAISETVSETEEAAPTLDAIRDPERRRALIADAASFAVLVLDAAYKHRTPDDDNDDAPFIHVANAAWDERFAAGKARMAAISKQRNAYDEGGRA